MLAKWEVTGGGGGGGWCCEYIKVTVAMLKKVHHAQAFPDFKWPISKGIQIFQNMTTEYTPRA